MKRFILLLVIFLCMGPAYAQQVRFDKNQLDLLTLAQDYLAGIKNLKANFIQVNPESSIISSGEIFVSKPGKLKMSYASPYKIDYYINDDDITQYDHDLDEVTRGAAPDNPLKVLLYNDITLANNDLMDVTNVVDQGQVFYVFMLNRAQEVRDISGMILKFRKNPVEIMGIQRVDYEGNKTETNLTAVEVNKDIQDSEFRFKKPKPQYPK